MIIIRLVVKRGAGKEATLLVPTWAATGSSLLYVAWRAGTISVFRQLSAD
jgi:hypothetical protein